MNESETNVTEVSAMKLNAEMEKSSTESSSTVRVSLSRLPATGRIMLGRAGELKALDHAWNDDGTHVISLVAPAGVGKTALMKAWLKRMKKDGFRGAETVYGWSFYSQGTSEEREISSDEFIYDALNFFGYNEPPAGSPADRGRALGRLVRERKTLLILDGLEPLQHPPGFKHGALKDPAIRALLEELCLYQPGLCLLTTRLAIKDIDRDVNQSVARVCLGRLSPKVGARILKKIGVNGSAAELEAAAEAFDGHALALNLLGDYLTTAHGGDIRRRDQVPECADDNKEGPQARRVLACFEEYLDGKPELNILRIMGIFDRPAEPGAISALRSQATIDGVTSEVGGLSDNQWLTALKQLRKMNLLAKKDPSHPDTLDCHPLVREYFGERLRESNPDAWRDAHSCLFDYYCNLPGQRYPDTLEDMEPLFYAITHGCQAGRHREALDEVYYDRIRRGNTAYSVKKLGAVGADLAALSDFFDEAWKKPTNELNEFRQALVLSWVGSRLRPLGRLKEAAQVVNASLEAFILQENWKEAAVNASNLGEIYLSMGKLDQATEAAEQGVGFAERSNDIFQQMVRCCDLAHVHHQAGRLLDAERLFWEAEAMQRERQQKYPMLYSLQGYQYCDLLMSLGKYREVRDRANQTLEWVTQAGWLLDISMDELSLGRAHWQETLSAGGRDFAEALHFLDLAVAGLRRAASQHHLPSGLLSRAVVFRHDGQYHKAWQDLHEVRESAQRGNMQLFLIDHHLEAARLCLAEKEKTAAREYLETAAAMVRETGYHRRDNGVQHLTASLA